MLSSYFYFIPCDANREFINNNKIIRSTLKKLVEKRLKQRSDNSILDDNQTVKQDETRNENQDEKQEDQKNE